MPSVCFPICILDVQYSVTLLTGEVGVKWDFYGEEIGKRIIVIATRRDDSAKRQMMTTRKTKHKTESGDAIQL